jgi:hypothetical protein
MTRRGGGQCRHAVEEGGTSVAWCGRRRPVNDSWSGSAPIGGCNPLLFGGDIEEISVITVKSERYWVAAGVLKLAYLTQYDKFMGMGDGKGVLLEISISSSSPIRSLIP